MFSILNFFERRTDLFHVMETPQDRMGFRAGQAQDMLMNQFHHFEQEYRRREQPHLLPDGAEGGNPAEGAAIVAAAVTAATGDSPSSAAAASAAGAAKATPPSPAEAAMPESTRKMMHHISTWNGAVTDKYHWSQSLRDITLEVEVEECRARDVKVDVSATRLCIKCKGKTVLEGKLHEKVNTEETMWHIEEGKQVVLNLEKQRETWWKCVLEGDQEIDTTKVESTRAMDEYDGETQGAIRKIMFDQNQKIQGKPTSDQIRTADIMKEAWNAPGSPFRGSEFDPSMLNLSGPVSEDFFENLEQKRIEEAQKRRSGD